MYGVCAGGGGGDGGRGNGRCCRQGPDSAGLVSCARERLDCILWAVVSPVPVHHNAPRLSDVQAAGPIPATVAQQGRAEGRSLRADQQPGDPVA